MSTWLSQFTVDQLPGNKSAFIQAGSQLVERDEQDVDSEQRLARAVQALGIGLTVLLLDRGWRLDTSLGQPVSLTNADVRIEPFKTITHLADGVLDPNEWRAWCSRYGIVGQRLGSAASHAVA